jgi:uncharacterized protein (TIGR03067 family)
LDRLQGTWNIVSLEMDGQKMPGGDGRIAVKGKQFTTLGMGAAYEGTLTVHEKTAPKGFDLHFAEGPEKGNTALGIYQLEGDRWKICLTTRGGDRPAEFAAPTGTGIALETLERASESGQPATKDTTRTATLPPGDDAPEIAGDWTPLSLVRNGTAFPQEVLKAGKRIATPNHVTVKFGPDVAVDAKYVVDRSRTPMTMDYLLKSGNLQHGIWMLENNQLTTCFGAPGAARPAEFVSAPGDGRTLAVWTPAK